MLQATFILAGHGDEEAGTQGISQCRSHNKPTNMRPPSDIGVIFCDSDGCVDELIPLWLEVGINGSSPLEVAAGMDAMALKREYGDEIILAGNIDKRALIRGGGAVDAEVDKARRLMDLGGYFPAVDQSVPPDVPYDNFRRLVNGLHG